MSLPTTTAAPPGAVTHGHPHSLRNTGESDLVFLTIFDPPRRPDHG
jgi:mannose-6-phosphate isomerase-like protein (cupin superfamily)